MKSNFIQAQIDSVSEWGRKEIRLPDGEFYLEESITWHNKGIYLIGGADTRLYFSQGIPGIVVTRSHSQAGRSRIENLFIRGQGDRLITPVNGISCGAVTKIENCIVQNFGGNGFELSGDASNGTDTSNSLIVWCEASECGRGFYTQGGDSNAICFISCSARDCDQEGMEDNSFLGCTYISPMTHANKAGGYATGTHGNNRTTFIGAYCEGGQPPSKVDGVTYVFGGITGPDSVWEPHGPNCKIIQQ